MKQLPDRQNALRRRMPKGSVSARRINISLPPELLARVDAMAADEMRSASSMVVKLLDDRLTKIKSARALSEGVQVEFHPK